MIMRTLTVRFARSVAPGSERGETVECVITPLNATFDPIGATSYIVGPSRQTAKLDRDRALEFKIVPTDNADLTDRVLYRIAWRVGLMGTISTEVFAMPNLDVSYASLHELDAIIGDLQFLKESDLGVAGRVAKLNPAGKVIDAYGNILDSTDPELAEALAQEVTDRMAADHAQTTMLQGLIVTSSSSVNSNQDSQRNAAIASLSGATNALRNDTSTANAALTGRVASVERTLPRKADLVGGRLPLSQAPAVTIGTPHGADDEEGMLSGLTHAVVGDICIRPDGTWLLTAPDTTKIGNWSQITTPSDQVSRVNDQVGFVWLTAKDVDARPAGVPLELREVTGLTARLSGIENTVGSHTSTIATTVKFSESGFIADVDLPTNIAFINAAGKVTNKAGEVMVVSGNVASVNGHIGDVQLTAKDVGAIGAGSRLPITSVETLRAELDARSPLASPTFSGLVTAPRISVPATNATGKVLTSNATGEGTWALPAVQSVNAKTGVITLGIADISGLEAELLAKASKDELQLTKNQQDRNTRSIQDLIATGGEGTGGVPTTVLSWQSPGAVANSTLISPYGINSDGVAYFDEEGAQSGEGAWPYVTPNGRLEIRKLTPGAAVDSKPATVADLAPVKADVASNTAAITTRASATALNGVAGRLSVVEGELTTFARASNPRLTGIAHIDSLRIGSSATAGRVLTADANGNATWKDAPVTTVAGRSGAVVIAQSDVGGLAATLAGKAPLASPTFSGGVTTPALSVTGGGPGAGKILASRDQFGTAEWVTPTHAPVTTVASRTGDVVLSTGDIGGLSAALGKKADLVGGKLQLDQIPSLALNDVEVVADKAAMHSLSPQQVQPGDLAIITSGPDQGSYVLKAAPASEPNNWVSIAAQTGGVVTVNNKPGPSITLTAADVSARPVGPIPQSDVTGLAAALGAKIGAGALTPYAKLEDIAKVSPVKMTVERCVTGNVGTMRGGMILDGVSTGTNSVRVLLAGQTASVENGIWITSSGAWSRPNDMSVGSAVLPGTQVIVTGGTTEANTIWQVIGTGVESVGSQSMAWDRSLVAAPPASYTGGPGIQVVGTKISADTGVGLAVSGTKVGIDTQLVARKKVLWVPGGQTAASVSHGLGNAYVSVTVIEENTGNVVLTGMRILDANTVSLYFETPPASNQFRAICIG